VGNTCRKIAPIALLSLLALGTDASAAGPASPHEATSQGADGAMMIPDASRRARVRSNRPSTVHAAYAAPERHAFPEEQTTLRAFEDAAFPEGRTLSKTILDEPADEWMQQLALPDMPVRWNAKTVEYLRFFRDDPQGRSMMRAWFKRKHRYEAMIAPILEEMGAPQSLIYVALAESGFDPTARSRVGAAGMWQFMEATGRVYGLSSGYWEDDRYDFERETWAAAAYLKDLKARFGSWELALAAYNAGYGLVIKSIRRYNTNNFWALCEIESGLPHATTNYVPKIMAAAIVGANLDAFGLEGDSVPRMDPARFMSVRLAPGTRLSDVAKALDVDRKVMKELNARFIRGRIPPDGEPRLARIPTSAAERVDGLGAALDVNAQPFTTHRVKEGQSLKDIAARYAMTEAALRRMNAVQDGAEITQGLLLVVPRRDALPEGASEKTPEAKAPPLVAVPSVAIPAGKKIVLIRATQSSTPRSLSTATGTRWRDIVAWNDLDPEARVLQGMWLQVVVDKDFVPEEAGVAALAPNDVRLVLRGSREHLEGELAQRELERRSYVAKKGDSLKRVARRFGLSVGSICRINGISRGHDLKRGESIILYVPPKKRSGTRPAGPPKTTSLTRELAALSQLTSPGAGDTEPVPETRPATTPTTARVPGRTPGSAPKAAKIPQNSAATDAGPDLP
jgi:membrane-bound lytic murein transglycosylase D